MLEFDRPARTKPSSNPRIGIEIEQESTDTSFIPPFVDGWRCVPDGSLRHVGFEYITTEKPRYAEAKNSLNTLFEVLEPCKKNFTNSYRTSVHVHLVASTFSTSNLVALAMVYWLVEPALMPFAGDSRKGNNFCLSPKYSGGTVLDIVKMYQGRRNSLLDSTTRYGSFNFAAYGKFRTAEFRLFRGTSDKDEIDLWVRLLLQIYEKALTILDPVEVSKFYSKCPAEQLVTEVLGVTLSRELAEKTGMAPETHSEEIREVASIITPITIALSRRRAVEEIRKNYEDGIKLLGRIPSGSTRRVPRAPRASYASYSLGTPSTNIAPRASYASYSLGTPSTNIAPRAST